MSKKEALGIGASVVAIIAYIVGALFAAYQIGLEVASAAGEGSIAILAGIVGFVVALKVIAALTWIIGGLLGVGIAGTLQALLE